ncbi:MAG TPA: hypothetical protein VJR25_07905 [Microbacterium sp.]|uniref:hypothetical protein n=1 Tax=Microbacterium sp. TaxID=51671 RepID=UPI002B48E417|nr:hypothetical protein [Microbacterium sp.]HKT56681.1 hypothetical protein [Microbacterium sp.]
MKTIQLRRYVLADGTYDEFVAWFNDSLLPARTSTGFAVEFAYGIRETNEFVWAVSVPGDAAAFGRIEEAYLASPERTAAFAGQPDRIAAKAIDLVEAV